MYVYDKHILARLGNQIGRTLRVDESTFRASRGKFARVSVEIDLNKPLISKFVFAEKVHRVEYEGLHTICFECGIFCHGKENCPTMKKDDQPNNEGNSTSSDSPQLCDNPSLAQDMNQSANPELENAYGAWMLAQAPKRRGRKLATASQVKNQESSDKNGKKPIDYDTHKVSNET